MRIWIDATRPECRLEVFGMSLLERQLRMFAMAERDLQGLEVVTKSLGSLALAERRLRKVVRRHIRAKQIWIELAPDAPEPDWIPGDLVERLQIRWRREPGTARERLQRALQSADGETVLAFSADAIVDTRLFEQLAWRSTGSATFLQERGSESAAAMRLEGPLPEGVEGESLLEIARSATKQGCAELIQDGSYDTYIAKLRRHLDIYVFRVPDTPAAARAERFLFETNYKGSTDFMTKWVYPPLVWRILRPLTARRVKPNAVTGIGIAACLAAVPLFAAGMWVPGLALAYVMSVLDSVDGKLARVTFTSSAQGDVLDHGTDILHPVFWYLAWAWGLSGGDPFSGVVTAAGWMCSFYILDRLLEVLFKASTGMSIHGYQPLDERMRTFISRRNVNLAVITVALPLGLGIPAFYAMTAWQAVSAGFHLTRVIKFWNVKDAPKKA